MSATHRGSVLFSAPQTKNKRFLKDFCSLSVCCFDKMGADNVKGSGRQIRPASPCSMRGAIQRAEKGSGFRTVSFEATEACESCKDHRVLFYFIFCRL